MPSYRVEVEHVTTTREVLHVEAMSVGDAETRAEIYESNGRRPRADVAVVEPRDVSKRQHSTARVIVVRERA